jgi:hypothetical protein
MIYKIDTKRLFFSFAIIMSRDSKKTDSRSIAFAIEALKPYIFKNHENPQLISKKKVLKTLDFCYKKSSNKKILNIPKSKFFRRFLKQLIKQKIIERIDKNNISNYSKDDIFIVNFLNTFLLLDKKNVRKLV